MLDLIAEGMAIRNQRPIQVAMSASATNPPVPANIRQHPPMLKTHENPDHAEGSTAKIRQLRIFVTMNTEFCEA
ncbi:hypothetical protein [uncultured Zhongshania sp.]|uniref:hypothetical protein n=1 Tax=uncultured Zhongshania sp. TaxID=1642288 RepID=UPI0030D9B496|tara:strand:+ start:4371 stop:4592 length:222 start_codon:yes stop_codon:yes gene_type:complete